MENLSFYALSQKKITEDSLKTIVKPIVDEESFENPLGGLYGQTEETKYANFLRKNDVKINGKTANIYNKIKFSTKIEIKPDAKVLYLDNYNAIENLNSFYGQVFKDGKFDYELLNKKGYDAICVNPKFCRGIFDTWGNESVLVLNPNCCEIVETKRFDPTAELKQKRQAKKPDVIDFDQKWNEIAKKYYKIEKEYQKDVENIKKVNNKKSLTETEILRLRNNANYRLAQLDKLNKSSEILHNEYRQFIAAHQENYSWEDQNERYKSKLQSFARLKDDIGLSIIKNSANIYGEQGIEKFSKDPKNIKKEKLSPAKSIVKAVLKKIGANYEKTEEMEYIKKLVQDYNTSAIKNTNDLILSINKVTSLNDLLLINKAMSLPEEIYSLEEKFSKNPRAFDGKLSQEQLDQIYCLKSYKSHYASLIAEENQFFKINKNGKDYYCQIDWTYNEDGCCSGIQVKLFNEEAKELFLNENKREYNYKKLLEKAYSETYVFSWDYQLMYKEADFNCRVGNVMKKQTIPKEVGECEIKTEFDVVKIEWKNRLLFNDSYTDKLKFDSNSNLKISFAEKQFVERNEFGDIVNNKVISFTPVNVQIQSTSDKTHIGANLGQIKTNEYLQNGTTKTTNLGVNLTAIDINTKKTIPTVTPPKIEAEVSIGQKVTKTNGKEIEDSFGINISTKGNIGIKAKIGDFENLNSINMPNREVSSKFSIPGIYETISSNGIENNFKNPGSEIKGIIEELKKDDIDGKQIFDFVKDTINNGQEVIEKVKDSFTR